MKEEEVTHLETIRNTDTSQSRAAIEIMHDPLPPTLRRGLPLVPSGTIAGKALITVIAIMTFLAALTASAALLVASASQDWRTDVSREMTIQIKPLVKSDIDVQLEKAAGIARQTLGIEAVTIIPKAESERFLEPWLGKGLDLVDLPIPRLIVLKLSGQPLDLASLRASLNREVAGASLDDHKSMVTHLAAMANTVIAIGLAVVGLVLIATALAVGFATRGALAGARDIVEVLHFVGADDAFIAREFQSRFFKLGLRGGLIGGGATALFLTMSNILASRFRASAGGDQIEALFGTLNIGWSGYGAILVIVAIVTCVTALVSKASVRRQLKELA